MSKNLGHLVHTDNSKDEVAIRVENVSKSFKLPHNKQSTIKSGLINFVSRGDRTYETQEALKDVSFEVKRGEFFGIVGRNGSGKSTLLKMLAGIYTPTKGTIIVNGSLTPFIELGVGFNPELTGKENIYLNGALLGFNRDEMSEMYDDIVKFAELERFMDQQLKNYSSGMQVRLAFSIAIRARSDILVLDEVLAVGDEAFQRKCDKYFQEIKNDKTKTIILVTHSMISMKRYCDRAIMISDGKLVAAGTPDDVANKYTEENLESRETENSNNDSGFPLGLSDRVPYFRIVSKSKKILTHKDELVFDVEYEITDDMPVRVFISIIDEKRGSSILSNGAKAISKKGRNKLTYVFPVKYYNDTDLIVNAVLDEESTRDRIAFTNEANSSRFAIRNKTGDNGWLRKDNDIHGHWVDWEEYMYNLKEE